MPSSAPPARTPGHPSRCGPAAAQIGGRACPTLEQMAETPRLCRSGSRSPDLAARIPPSLLNRLRSTAEATRAAAASRSCSRSPWRRRAAGPGCARLEPRGDSNREAHHQPYGVPADRTPSSPEGDPSELLGRLPRAPGPCNSRAPPHFPNPRGSGAASHMTRAVATASWSRSPRGKGSGTGRGSQDADVSREHSPPSFGGAIDRNPDRPAGGIAPARSQSPRSSQPLAPRTPRLPGCTLRAMLPKRGWHLRGLIVGTRNSI